MDNICVAVQGTVSIGAEEYRSLVTSQAYLNVIIEASKDDSKYSLVDSVVEVVSRLVEPVITGCEQGSDAPEVETDAK